MLYKFHYIHHPFIKCSKYINIEKKRFIFYVYIDSTWFPLRLLFDCLLLDFLHSNRYEVPRLWIYSGDEGSVSMTSPSLKYSRDGKKMILHGVFGMEEDVENRVVNLDMVMESNTLRIVKMHSTEVEIKSFLMIICEDLKIEFDPLTKRFGTLTESGKSCRVQVCPIEPHPLYDGVDKCNSY